MTTNSRIWLLITRLASGAELFGADLVVALVPVVDEGTDTDSLALLSRFVWPY